jgi:hypothetical protein
MTEPEITACGPKSTETHVRLRYGVNESDSWWYFH